NMAAFNNSSSSTSTSSCCCQVCTDIHPAIFRCDECEENLCQVAANIHQRGKSTKNHVLRPIDTEAATDITEPSNDIITNLMIQLAVLSPLIICPEHREEFKYFDEDCKKLLCRDCAIVTHHGHRCSFMKDTAHTKQVLLESSVQEARFQC
ncbi:MAG: B-box zinc finger protein, partial [bacterium]